MRHHEVQQKGRDEILADYHLRVGQITADNQVPAGYALTEQRLDETEVGEGTTVTLINATRPAEWKQTNNPYDCASRTRCPSWYGGMSGSMGGLEEEALPKRPAHGLICAWPTSNILAFGEGQEEAFTRCRSTPPLSASLCNSLREGT